MRLVDYSPQYFEALRNVSARVGLNSSLTHRPFVDYYYADNEWCKLHLLLASDDTVISMLGVDHMRFAYASREFTIGFGSNFYSLQPGAGTYLFFYWLKSCPIGLVFGGSDETHRILRKQGWTYFIGIKSYVLNKPYQPYPGDSWLKASAKTVLSHTRRARNSKYASRIPPEVLADISVSEEQAYTDDLLPRQSPFMLRFAPSLQYLRWRYNTALSFVCYRLFRVLSRGKTIGYVILNESPKQVIVAHCDGEDAAALAYGVLLSILQITTGDKEARTVSLISSHAIMQQIYERFGFRAERTGRPFALGTLGPPIDLVSDTSNWLINFDWGDNGLRAPFRDQSRASSGS